MDTGAEPIKRKRGRPRKTESVPELKSGAGQRKRGRPPKAKTGAEAKVGTGRKKRGRPPKTKSGTGVPMVVGTGLEVVEHENETYIRKVGADKTKVGTGKKKPGRRKGSVNKNGYNVSSVALLTRREAAGALPARTEEERNYNAQLINHIMRIQEIASHADRKDPVSLRSCFFAYLRLCQEDGFRVGNIAAAAAMGVEIHTIYAWAQSSREEYRELARLVKSMCAMSREEMISDQKINPVTGIFWQRNFDGLRNDTEQIQQQKPIEEEQETTTEITEKYGHLLEE